MPGVCRKEQYLTFHIAGAIGCPGSGLGQVYCQEAIAHSPLAWLFQAFLSLLSSDTFSPSSTCCGFLLSPLSVETGPKRQRAHQLPSTSNNSASPLGPTFCSLSPTGRKTGDPYPLLKFIWGLLCAETCSTGGSLKWARRPSSFACLH